MKVVLETKRRIRARRGRTERRTSSGGQAALFSVQIKGNRSWIFPLLSFSCARCKMVDEGSHGQLTDMRQMQAMMESCFGKSAISGVMGFGMGGLFGLFMASVSPLLSLTSQGRYP